MYAQLDMKPTSGPSEEKIRAAIRREALVGPATVRRFPAQVKTEA